MCFLLSFFPSEILCYFAKNWQNLQLIVKILTFLGADLSQMKILFAQICYNFIGLTKFEILPLNVKDKLSSGDDIF